MDGGGSSSTDATAARGQSVVSLNHQAPLLEPSYAEVKTRRPRSCFARLARPCCCLIVAAISAAASAATTFFVTKDLLTANTSVPEDWSCPGVCAGRTFHGTYAANVTATKTIGVIKILIGFEITHSFDAIRETVNVSVVPTDVEPKLIPFRAFTCNAVPFHVDDACNMTWMDDCLFNAYREDMIKSMTYRWDPSNDALLVTETIDVHFLGVSFTQVFRWVEHRQ